MTNKKIDTIVDMARRHLEIHFIRSSGHGGQNVNKRSTCCQIIDHFDYLPFLTEDQIPHHHSPIVVKHGARRRQHKNKEEALHIWKAKVKELLSHHYSDTCKSLMVLGPMDISHLRDAKKQAHQEREYRSIFRQKIVSHDTIQDNHG